MTEIHVDAWDPSYGAGFDPDGGGGRDRGPDSRSAAQLTADIERPVDDWSAVDARAGTRAPDVVLLVDGVRRIDARLWITGEEGTNLGLAASYAAGVVSCDLARGVAQVASARIARGLFTANADITDFSGGSINYVVHRGGRGDFNDLIGQVQAQLRALEVDVSAEARVASDLHDDLLVVDGPLQGRAHLPRALGYVKTHQVEYLPTGLSTVVTTLRPGQRCPVFLLTAPWPRYSWYLRLPGPVGAPWAGIVRLECSADLEPHAAIALADRSVATLPRFASTSYKDPRAPQNLVPIAGLERRLKAMLGDARLLHRALTLSSRRRRVPA